MCKNAAMKPSLSFLFILFLLLSSCQLLDPPLSMGQPREEHGGMVPSDVPAEPDTSLFVTALCFPASYDWRKDSLYGRVECVLKLFRNGEEVLALAAGPGTKVSSSQDAHHVIDGHLYTEFQGSGGTTLSRDGEEIASWYGAERLCGLLVKDDVLHTLSYGAKGLVYRRKGAEVLRVADGEPIGGFRQDTWEPTGALYEQDGRICFAFQAPREGRTTVFIVRDGEPEAVLSAVGAQALDARLLVGSPSVIYNRNGVTRMTHKGESWNLSYTSEMLWEDAGAVLMNGKPVALGRYRCRGDRKSVCCIGRQNQSATISGDPASVFVLRDSSIVAVKRDGDIPPDCYYLSRDCACLSPNGELTMALTPRDISARPYVLCGGEKQEYPVYGFITSVSYHITH